jgi:hypothetical protein
MESLNIESAKYLCIAFSKFSGPLLGNWACPSEISSTHIYNIDRDSCGGLYIVYLEEGRLYAAELNSSYYIKNGPWEFVFDRIKRSLVLVLSGPGTNFAVCIHDDVLRLGEERLYRLPPLCSSRNNLEHVLGMHYSYYGPHGRELLWISRHYDVENDSIYPVPNEYFMGADRDHIRGMKLIGDPNVPGGQLSFCANMSEQQEVGELIDDENRLIFSSLGAVDLRTRARFITHWFRGYGQINYVQGVWNPRWQRISFLVYKIDR